MINRIRSILKREISETKNFAIESAVQLSLKKEFGVKAMKNSNAINDYYDHFSANVIKLYSSLDKEYNIKKYDGERLKNEIKAIKENIKMVNSDNKILKKIGKVMIGKTIMKWQSLSIILEQYKDLLDFYEKISDLKYCGNIDLDNERQMLNDAMYLKEDFSLIK